MNGFSLKKIGFLCAAVLATSMSMSPLPCLAKNTQEQAAAKDTEVQMPNVRQLIQEGLNCLILEQGQKAEEAFLKAKTLDPYSEEAYNFLGLLYLQQGLYQKAEDMLSRAIAIEPLYVEALRNLGKLYLQQERFSEASSYLRRAFALDRSQAYTAYLLGMSLYFSGQIEKAVQAYEDAFAADPHLPTEARYNLGVAYHESARYLDAVREYEAVIKAEPEHLNALNNLGLVFSVLGEKDRAVDLFNRVLKVDANNVKARINLGNVYLNTKDLVEAEKIYRTAITLDAKDISPRLNLGVVYFERGEFDKARDEWETLLASDPKNLKVLSVMASAYLEKKQYDEAIRIFKQLVDLMPDNGSIANTLGFLLADQNRELDHAQKLIEKAIELDPANRATYLDSLAWVQYRRGNFKEARRQQDRAIKIFGLAHESISSEVLLHMGRIYEKTNEKESALKAYQEAVKNNSDPEMVKLASESLELLMK
ncbi:MAG: tetratricopeptide repeat protein [Candidatus Ozemobacteraceae bacterium]